MKRLARRIPFLQHTAGAYDPLPQNDEEVQLQRPSNGATSGLSCSRLYHRWLDGEFTMIPGENRLLDVWDVAVLLALVHTGTVLPYEVAFFQGKSPVLLGTDYVVNLVFVVDMLLTFMVAFPVHWALTDHFERAPVKILKHYMDIPHGCFWADLLTVIPWHHLMGFHSIFNSMRVSRIFRLVRMVRLKRILKLTGRWSSRTGVSYAFVDTLKCITVTFALLHWLSCIWGFLAVSGHKQGLPTWYSTYILMLEEDMQVFTPHVIYTSAVYFCSAALTGVGYGDIAPKNLGEIVLSTFTILWAGFIWAGVVAIIINVVTNWDPYANDFQKLSDDLNLLMESRALPSDLRARARSHLQESFEVCRQRFQRKTIQALSPGLQVEVAIASGALEVIENVSYLRGLGPEVITELVSFLEPDLYSPCEFVVDKRSVSVIRRGFCWWKTKVISRDAVIGEDMILACATLRDAVRPKTLTHVELMSLSRTDLGRLCSTHPHFSHKIRLAQVRMAMRRGIVRYAQRLRRAQQRQEQVDGCKLTVKALEGDPRQSMFHEDSSSQLLATQEAVLGEVRTISSELQLRKERKLEKESPSWPSCSHEHKEEHQERGRAREQQAMCSCADVFEAIDRLARLQEQLRDRIDEALAERRLPQGVSMNNSPTRMTNPSSTEAHFNLNDKFTPACAGSSTGWWPGSRLPDGTSGGSHDTWQQLSSVAKEAQLDVLAPKLARSASAGPPGAASVLGAGQTSEDQLAWITLFQRQSAKIDSFQDSLELLLGHVSEALGHACDGSNFDAGYYGAGQQREDGPVARYRRLTQQLHQQNQQRQQPRQHLQMPQQMHPMQHGQVAGDTGQFVANSQLGFFGVSQSMTSWQETREDRFASRAEPGRLNSITISPM